jgi:chemotaxis protein MotB
MSLLQDSMPPRKIVVKPANMNKIDLLSQLDAKAKALAIEQERLSKSAQRLQELENLIRQRGYHAKVKETLSNALNGFEGKGLTVEQKNGKVYV